MSLPPLRFHGGKFTVLHVTDIQDMHYIRRAMFRFLDTAYDHFRPDLVILAGDNILGNHICDSRIPHGPPVTDPAKELRAVKKAIDYLVAPIVARGIPFAVVFGNHDDTPHFTKEDMAAIYRSYPGCYGLGGETETGDADNDVVTIFSSDGARAAYNLWLINSVRHTSDGAEEFVSERAVAWYKRTSGMFTAENGGKPVPALWFQHMPLPETALVLAACAPGDRGAVKGPDGKWYRLRHGKGIMNRYPRMCVRSNGEFAAMKACGDVKAVVTGHDHINHFSTRVDGIDLILTPCVSLRCNSNRTRGVRTFVLDEESGSYKTQFYSYQDLLGTSIRTELPYLIQADGLKKERITLACGAAAATCVLVGGAIAACRALKR